MKCLSGRKDLLGSVHSTLDADFSADADNKSDIDNEYLYTGRRLDPETGLQLNRNRFYASGLGRWVNRDPIEYDGGMNLYWYVGGRPTRFVDPSGLDIFGPGNNNPSFEEIMDHALDNCWMEGTRLCCANNIDGSINCTGDDDEIVFPPDTPGHPDWRVDCILSVVGIGGFGRSCPRPKGCSPRFDPAKEAADEFFNRPRPTIQRPADNPSAFDPLPPREWYDPFPGSADDTWPLYDDTVLE